jgi:tRNA/tmRNA/rRNA uracil-C5-methylase (TrmA/RlmC/RlmD family)
MHLTIDKLIHGGNGLGTLEGKRIFVPFAAPGDRLDVEVVKDHGTFAEARILSVIEPAPCRVIPRCPVFGRCGGCQWQHLSYEAQLSWKREILRETLAHLGGVADPDVLPAIPSPKPWNYRNRIQLHVDSQGHAGFYRPKSHEVVEFEACAVADEQINVELSARREEIGRRDRGIALRVDGSEGFGQVNSEQNEQLKKLLCAWLAEIPHEMVLELHAGSGNFTFALARVARSIIASDIDGRAVRAAMQHLEIDRLTNVQFLCMPDDRAVRRHANGCDCVVIDPPRKGAAEAVSAIVEAKPHAILSISCDPATLARDVRILCDNGYRLVRSQPIDMFPQTFHIESLTLLTRAS